MSLLFWMDFGAGIQDSGVGRLNHTYHDDTSAELHSDGAHGGYVYFDGTNQITYNQNTNDVTDCYFTGDDANFSWSIWVNTDARDSSFSNTWPFTVGRADYGERGYGLRIDETQALLFYGNQVIIIGGLETGKWFNIAFTKNGKTLKGYLNGKLAATVTFSGTHPTYGDALGIGIGAFYFNAGAFYQYKGKVADFRIYNTALSANEIKQIYKSDELVAWYPLNGNSNDFSPYRNRNIIASDTLSYTTNYASTGKTYQKCATSGSLTVKVAKLVDEVTFSYSFWVYTNTDPQGDWRDFFSIYDNGSNMRFQTCKLEGYPRYGVYNNPAYVSFTNNAPAFYASIASTYGKWHHIVVTRDEKYVKMFLDGSQSSFVGTSTGAALPGTFVIYPGENSRSNISDIRVYNYVLSQKEINDLYRAPVALYNFEGFTQDNGSCVNIYSGEYASGRASEVGYTWFVSGPTKMDGYYKYTGKIESAYDGDGWLCFNWPTYAFEVNTNYTLSFDMRINKADNINFLIRHGRVPNDHYYYDCRTTVMPNSATNGNWQRVVLQRTFTTKFTVEGIELTTNPRFEIISGNINGTTFEFDFDIKNVMITATDKPATFNKADTISYIPDNSGHKNSLTIQNAAQSSLGNTTVDVSGNHTFYLTNGYLYMPSIFNKMMVSEGFTYNIDFWMAGLTTAALLCDRTSIGTTLAIFILGNDLRVDTAAGQHIIKCGLQANIMYRLVYVNDGATNYVYLNGVLKDSWDGKIDKHGSVTSIGASQVNGSRYENYFNGLLSTIEFYATPFTSSMVAEYYKTKIRVSDNYDFHGYNVIEDSSNIWEPVSLDHQMNANFSDITEDPGTSEIKFYDDASIKAHQIYSDAAVFESANVNGNMMALSLDLNKASTLEISKGIAYCPYDSTIYTEPDGSKWIRLFHHNNPINGVFTSASSAFPNNVYESEDRWFAMSICSNQSGSWEFLVKQKQTSDGTEYKYRFIQMSNPMTASYEDVYGHIIPNTSSGYSAIYGNDGKRGGLHKLADDTSTYLACANQYGGNWWGAAGCHAIYISSGIPGYNEQIVSTGYYDIYLRVASITDSSDSNAMTSQNAVGYIDNCVSKIMNS